MAETFYTSQPYDLAEQALDRGEARLHHAFSQLAEAEQLSRLQPPLVWFPSLAEEVEGLADRIAEQGFLSVTADEIGHALERAVIFRKAHTNG